jgi:hypothetical protein
MGPAFLSSIGGTDVRLGDASLGVTVPLLDDYRVLESGTGRATRRG